MMSSQKGEGGKHVCQILDQVVLKFHGRRIWKPPWSIYQNNGSVIIGYYDYVGKRPKNSHRPIIVTGQ